MFDELVTVWEECRQPNWDGYGAAPVTQDALRNAYVLLEALPLGTPAPAVWAESDGQLTFEWHRSPWRTLSVSISPEGELHYAALLGPGKHYASEPFFGEAPRVILDLIRQMEAA